MSAILDQILLAGSPKNKNITSINLGIASSGFASHIASVTHHYSTSQQYFPKLLEIHDTAQIFPSIAELGLDVLIISQHWNDLVELDEYMSKNCLEENSSFLLDLDFLLNKTFETLDLLKDQSKEPKIHKLKSKIDQTSSSFSKFIECPYDYDISLNTRRVHLEFMLRLFIERMKKYSPETKLLLMTQPTSAIHAPTGNDSSIEYQKIQKTVYQTVSKEYGIPLVDIAKIYEQLARRSKRFDSYGAKVLLVDDVHFSEIGNAFQAHIIAGEVASLLNVN